MQPSRPAPSRAAGPRDPRSRAVTAPNVSPKQRPVPAEQSPQQPAWATKRPVQARP
jgi:hypothetical protein